MMLPTPRHIRTHNCTPTVAEIAWRVRQLSRQGFRMPIIRKILCLFATLGALVSSSILHAQDAADARGAANSAKRTHTADERGEAPDEKAAVALKERADQLQRRYDWSVYGRHIAEAQRAWEIGSIDEAWRHLNASRGDLRGWEHDHLFSLFTKDHRIFKTQGGVASVAFSADGQRLVSGYAWVVRTWECATGRELLTFSPRMNHTSLIGAAAVSPDGKRIALGAEGRIHAGTVMSGHFSRRGLVG